MWIKFRHKVVFIILRPIFRLILKFSYRYSFKRYKLDKGPYLILYNHVTTLDPVLVAMSFKRPIYYMASDDLFSIKYVSFFIRYLVNPIPKSKSFRDLQAIRDSLKVAKEGGIICVAPEGNRTYSGRLANVDRAIVKYIKLLKIPLIIYNIHGGFGTKPRFASHVRHGKSYGEVNKLLQYDDYKDLSDDDLYDLIVDGLTVDDFDFGINYKSKNRAEFIERVVYLCPCCGEVGAIESHKNHFHCNKCGLNVEYGTDLKLKVKSSPNDKFKFETIYEYFKYQENWIYNLEIIDDIVYFEDADVNLLSVVKNKKKTSLAIGTLRMDSKSISIVDEEGKEYKYLFSEITGMTVLGMNKLNFYIDKEIYQIKSNVRFNALKYMQLYYHIKHLEKGELNGFLGI